MERRVYRMENCKSEERNDVLRIYNPTIQNPWFSLKKDVDLQMRSIPYTDLKQDTVSLLYVHKKYI